MKRATMMTGGLACAIGLAACTRMPLGGDRVDKWGSTREVLREGKVEGRVALADLPLTEYSFGVGALKDLAGEITIDGGTVWISEAKTPRDVSTTRDRLEGRDATLMLLGQVRAWEEHEVTHEVRADEVDDYLAAMLGSRAEVESATFPFVVEGPVTDLHMHVIAGECPMRARMLGQEVSKPPYRFETARVSTRLIGIYQLNGGGDISHMGSDTHIHALVPHSGVTITGHVESVALAKGAVVRVPAD